MRLRSAGGIFGTSGICSLDAVCGDALAGESVDGESVEGMGRGGCLLMPSVGEEGTGGRGAPDVGWGSDIESDLCGSSSARIGEGERGASSLPV